MFTRRRRRPAADADDDHIDQMLSKHVALRRPPPLSQTAQRRGMDRPMQLARSADKGTDPAPDAFPREMVEERKSDGGHGHLSRHGSGDEGDAEFHFGRNHD